jgi:ABC-type branched-subunit amino acid transport system ATPase component
MRGVETERTEKRMQPEEMPLDRKIMEVEGVTKFFARLRAVSNVSLTMDKGKIYGLVGPNGAGKTTLFNVLTGFLKPDSGEIYYKSVKITRLRPDKVVRMGIARTFQNVRAFPSLSALEHIMIGFQQQAGETALGGMFGRWKVSERANKEKALAFLDRVGLKGRAYDKAEDLSYPEQKILILSRLVATGAEFLLIDEPTSGMDPASFRKMLAFMRDLVDNHGKTLCVVEHNLDLIREICDWIFFLHHGELIAGGTVEDIIHREDLAEIYFGRERAY